MSEDLWGWLLAVIVGGVVSLLYFSGLWWTVQRVPRARNPALLVAASYLVRTAMAAAALIVVASGDALRVLAGLAGFRAMRMVFVRSVRGGGSLTPMTGAVRGR